MSGIVRVRENGFEYNTGAARAEAKSLEVLDEPTHRPGGRPRPVTRVPGRPVKPKTSVAEKVAEKAGKSAEITKAAVIESAPTNEEN
jgi:hypothetical protein